MPTSVGHAFAGVLINEISDFNPGHSFWKSLWMAILLANLADLDFIPGILSGNPNKYHHAYTHSLGATLLVGGFFSLYYLFKYKQFKKPFIYSTGLYASHLILDFLTLDSSAPYGIPLFWPLSDRYYTSPVILFTDIHKASNTTAFFKSLFVAHNGWAIFRECLILGPVILLFYTIKNLKQRVH